MTLLYWLSVVLTIVGLIGPAIATATPLTQSRVGSKPIGMSPRPEYPVSPCVSQPATHKCTSQSPPGSFKKHKLEGRRQKAEVESVSFIRSGWRVASEAAPQKLAGEQESLPSITDTRRSWDALNQFTATKRRQPQDTYTGFNAYPLPTVAPVVLDYGWYQEAKTGEDRFHSGIDLQAESGTPVLCVDQGTVAFAGEQGSYGNLVVVNHQGGRQTRYAHLQDVFVRTGQKVKPQDKLGTVGSTGQPDSNQPHLHFEVRYSSSQGWVAQDPKPNLKVQPTTQR